MADTLPVKIDKYKNNINWIVLENQKIGIFKIGKNVSAGLRIQEVYEDNEVIDVFSKNHQVFLGSLTLDSIQLKSGNEWKNFSGDWAVYVPPYTLLRWKIKKGHYSWIGLSWESEFTRIKLEKGSILFPWKKDKLIFDENSFVKKMNNIKYFLPINCIENDNAVSLKTKKYIDLNYAKTESILSISKHLKISSSTMTHYFKKAYSLSPIQYRNRLRTAEAMRLLLSEDNSAFKVKEKTGFGDYSRLYRSLLETYGISPSLLARAYK